ncbi:MAG TPA: N-acetylglucosamine-6-phosphate deacetylase, partial [Chloroflexota bacterium]
MADPTPQLLIHNVRVYGPDLVASPGWLLTEGSSIAGSGQGRAPQFPANVPLRLIDGDGRHLLPGFIDLHVHGAAGHEVMDASATALRAMARFFVRHGVTSFLPTTWTAPPEATLHAIDSIAAAVGPVEGGATILGAHLEGPYLNVAKCGAQDPLAIRRADPAETSVLLDRGVIRLLALAPEYEENLALLDECVRRGVTVSLAHTGASYEQVLVAAERGARQATHTFNAMTGFGHREPGVAGAALALPQIRCELIADTVHVHPAAIRVLVAAKGPAGVILITDAIRATGMPDGDYAIDSRTITVREGQARLPDGTLAGSVLTMDVALRNVAAATGLALVALWPMTSLNAARAVGLSARKGSLEVGKDADLVLLDDRFEVALTVAEGAI